jgi:CO/xanthine dehydrogenase Mo-binding subunit
MIATAPAIANAVYDALGIRFNDLPLTAERIYMALQGDPKPRFRTLKTE